MNSSPLQNLSGVCFVKRLRFFRVGRGSLVVALLLLGALAPPAETGEKLPGSPQNTTKSSEQNFSGQTDQPPLNQADQITEIEKLKDDIIEINIFQPAKPISISTTEENPQVNLRPDPLKNPFTLLGTNKTDQGMQAHLAFEKPTLRVEEVKVGYIIEKIITIEAIELLYIRCLYNDQEVRIAVGESSTDAWKRLVAGELEYKLLGTAATASGGYEAQILVTNIDEKTYRTVQMGDKLGDATVKFIEKGLVILINALGNEILLKHPLSPRW
ncbi:hypothetical protein ACFL02_00890 [Planctomycetota bacterium]